MEFEPLVGTPVRFPPGHVAVRLDDGHRRAYREIYATYRSNFTDLPVIRDRDLDGGRPVKLSRRALNALNRAFASFAGPPGSRTGSAFEAQERDRSDLFRRTQFLS